MINDLLTKPCTITRRSPSGATDGYGNALTATSNASAVCELQQLPRRADAEPTDELSDTQWLLVLLPGTAIDTSDTVTVDGKIFEVVGAPWPARDPSTGEEHHIEANLRRIAAATDA